MIFLHYQISYLQRAASNMIIYDPSNDKLSCRAGPGTSFRILSATLPIQLALTRSTAAPCYTEPLLVLALHEPDYCFLIQFSICSPLTRRNSFSLLVTRTNCRDMACAASSRSIGPIG